MAYKRVRKDSKRKLVVKWRIDYGGDDEPQSLDITTTIDDENMRYNWKEWDEFKFEASKTESVELDIRELFNNKLSWDIEEIKDVGSGYDGDSFHTVEEKVDKGWYKSVPEWDKHFEEPDDYVHRRTDRKDETEPS